MLKRFALLGLAALAAPLANAEALIPRKDLLDMGFPAREVRTAFTILEQFADPPVVCNELSAALPIKNDTLVQASGAAYNRSENENYSTLCRLPAACIVTPTTTDEVATAVKIIDKHDAVFAVRSGGFNWNPGFASIDETGILVSLTDLNTIKISDDLSTVIVGAGNRWQAVYDALVPKGRMVMGARTGPVGVGGLTLGGGLNYFSAAYGLAVDSVKSYEVVLGDGSVVNASINNEHADLYKALRGGVSNFGIVTHYEYYTYPIKNMLIDARAYGPNQTAEFFKAFAAYQEQGQLNTRTSVTVQVLETGPTLLMLYDQGGEPLKDEFDPFYALKPYFPILPAMNGTLLDVLALSGSRFVDNVRIFGETYSHLSDANLMIDLYNIFAEETAKLPANVTGVWVPNPISESMVTLGEQRGGNVLGLVKAPQVWYESFITWNDPAHDDLIREVTERITQRCIAKAKEEGLDLPYLFANVASRKQEVIQSYGAWNAAFMKRVAEKYDPSGVFQVLQQDGFLLRDI